MPSLIQSLRTRVIPEFAWNLAGGTVPRPADSQANLHKLLHSSETIIAARSCVSVVCGEFVNFSD